MLDKRTEMMLEVANTLTAEDLDEIRTNVPLQVAEISATEIEEGTPSIDVELAEDPSGISIAGSSRGERERMRTRESKISTACVSQQRQKHEWWPIGTELVGHIGAEQFTGTVVRNGQVKSGRSILIASGTAQGKVCQTPTRAAIEATEAYRQAHNLGRGGGVTNGWTFWKPRE